MSFSYSQYLIECLVFPILLIMFSLSLGCAGVLSFVHRNRGAAKIVIRGCLCLFVCVFFLGINIGILSNGGIALILDRGHHAETVYGEITNIEGMGRFQFPKMKSEYGYGETNGVFITVEGLKLKAPVHGELKVGDTVMIKYLPNSKYIIAISHDHSS